MPDFDIDFDERRRGEVIRYVSEKYGEERVAQIATFGRLKSKAAIKDANRVLDYPFAHGRAHHQGAAGRRHGQGRAAQRPVRPDDKRYGDGAGLPQRCTTSDADVRKIYETALGLEGQIRQWGVHAAGVIMSSDPLIDIVPIMKREQDGAIITQFDYPMCEALGLVKMDFLGLRNLTVLDDALDNIKRNRDVDLVLEDLAFDDPATYELLARGDTLGVFQLDGGPMRPLLRSMQPDKFEDISAVGALYRPGPMGADSHNKYARRKNGKRADRPDPSRARRAARDGARRDLRPDRLSRAGHGDRAGAGRVLARTGRQPAPRDGQEEEVRARQAVRRLRGRHARARLLAAGGQDAVGHPAARSPTTPSTRRTRRHTASSPTGRPTSRPTTRPSTWRPC